MNDEINIIEQEDGVTVKQEHAYASKDESELLHCYDSSEEDPLKIFPSDVNRIKTENECDNIETVEIKVEPDFIHEQEEMEISQDSGNMNGSLNENIVVEKPIYSENVNLSGEFVPKYIFMDLQNKYHNVCKKYFTVSQKKNPVIGNNNEINNVFKNRFLGDVKDMRRDLKRAQMLGNKLKFEISYLAKQNSFLRKKLKDCASNFSYEEAMEKSVNQLKERVQSFVALEKQNCAAFKNIKSKLDYKECEEKVLEKRLQQATSNLDFLKQKLIEASTLKSMLHDTQMAKEKLQKELTDCMKVRYLYEDHADMIKRELNAKLKEKEAEMEKLEKENQKLSLTCQQHEHNGKIFREKMKVKFEQVGKKANETGKLHLLEKQKSESLEVKLLEQHNENAALKKKIQELKAELRKHKEADLERKFAEKSRENGMLREEIAMLKVELEKHLPKFAQC